jgi:hypothetical protein
MVDKWEHWWENHSTWIKTCCCANMANTNPLQSILRLDLGPCVENPVAEHLSYGVVSLS